MAWDPRNFLARDFRNLFRPFACTKYIQKLRWKRNYTQKCKCTGESLANSARKIDVLIRQALTGPDLPGCFHSDPPVHTEVRNFDFFVSEEPQSDPLRSETFLSGQTSLQTVCFIIFVFLSIHTAFELLADLVFDTLRRYFLFCFTKLILNLFSFFGAFWLYCFYLTIKLSSYKLQMVLL